MYKYFLILIMLTICSKGFGQDNDSLNKYFDDNLYFKAVVTFIDSTYNSTPDTSDVNFLKDVELLNYLPEKIGKTKISHLFYDELKDKFYKTKLKTLVFYELSMLNDKNIIFVFIKQYEYCDTNKNNKLTLTKIVGDFAIVNFLFDCNQNKFRVSSFSPMKHK